ncbi:MAG: hypothetical protein LBS31_08375 [Candidatus Adiutrix sp.]|jgi:hypothetical protein|nr:hypothetical protein [Candidatus Adiutrix sp.]
MAVCPKCGRPISEKIYMPLSEAGAGQKIIRCACGHETIYRQPGYEEREKKRIADDYKRRADKHRENVIDEGFSKSYDIFVICCAIAIMCSSLYALIVNIINKNIGTGILLFLFSLLLLLIVLAFMSRTASYPVGAVKSLIRQRRNRAVIYRIIGVVFGVAIMAFYIMTGFNGLSGFAR